MESMGKLNKKVACSNICYFVIAVSDWIPSKWQPHWYVYYIYLIIPYISYDSWIYSYLCNLPITTKVASSNPPHGEVYSIQQYVIQFISDLWQVAGFRCVLWFPSWIKQTATILLNVVESGIKHHNSNTNPYIFFD
jgi:hypothetical protein